MAFSGRKLKTLHLFAGAGGGILADLLLGHEPIGAVEIEDYPRQVLLARQRDGIFPKFPIWDDVTTFRRDNPDTRDFIEYLISIRGELCICGGFPCQDISSAGKGAGIIGERSGMWFEMLRIFSEIRPARGFVENSSMLRIRGLGTVLGGLDGIGYNAQWTVLGGRNVGAPNLRNRIWILASNANEMRFQQSIKKQRVLAKKIGPGSNWNGQLARIHDNNLARWGWTNSSTFTRVADGLAQRNNRLKSTGNGQIPLVAALAFRVLESNLQPLSNQQTP